VLIGYWFIGLLVIGLLVIGLLVIGYWLLVIETRRKISA